MLYLLKYFFSIIFLGHMPCKHGYGKWIFSNKMKTNYHDGVKYAIIEATRICKKCAKCETKIYTTISMPSCTDYPKSEITKMLNNLEESLNGKEGCNDEG